MTAPTPGDRECLENAVLRRAATFFADAETEMIGAYHSDGVAEAEFKARARTYRVCGEALVVDLVACLGEGRRSEVQEAVQRGGEAILAARRAEWEKHGRKPDP